ncbi:MAG: alginate export family protein [Acidobacteria bacterium]|nr:alginate export family protein [Acidobacteriota bacterium]
MTAAPARTRQTTGGLYDPQGGVVSGGPFTTPEWNPDVQLWRDEPSGAFERDGIDPKPGRRDRPEWPRWLGLEFEQRSRYETLSNRFRRGETGSDQQLAQRTRLRLELKEILGPVRFQLELADSRVHLDDQGSRVTNAHENRLDLLQLNMEMASKDLLGSRLPSSLRLGRFTMDLGKRRLVARNSFRNTTNAFDGVRWSLGNPDDWQLHTFLVNPVTRRLGMMDDRRDPKNFFWGIFLSAWRKRTLKADLYYLGLHHSPSDGTQKRRFSTLGTRFFKSPKRGDYDFELESVWQFGSVGALDHLAHFQHAELGYTIARLKELRLAGLYDYASGDGDPNDRKSGAFDTLYGARFFDFGPTGIMGTFTRSNLNSPAYRAAWNITPAVDVAVTHRFAWLAQARDQWVGTSLRDPSGRSGTFLGNQVDARVRWGINPYLRIETGYSHFAKGSFARHVPGSPTIKASDYFYVATELAWRGGGRR